jgi:hypothetical protein
MNQQYKILYHLFLGVMVVGILFIGCDKDDVDMDNSIELLSFGPSPALRGGELKIIGNNLDKVTAVILPHDVNVTSFNSKDMEMITLTIPEETLEGKITLKTPEGDITSLSILTIEEPIVVSSFSPTIVRPGDALTINGDYLNLIKTVIFSSNVSVGDTLFTSQSKEKIVVSVPEQAQTGAIAVSNGEEIPIIVESESELNVTIPLVTQLAPNPVKAGAILTITARMLQKLRL